MIVVLCSLAGAPGATALSVAVAAWWPAWQDAPVLVEADASGGDIATWRGFGTEVGLVSLAAHLRSATDEERGLLRHSRMLDGGQPVVVAPPSASRSVAAVQILASHAQVLRHEAATIVDVGRVAPESAGAQIMAAADAVVVLAHDHAPQLRRVRESAQLFEQLRAPVGLAVRGTRFGDEEIADQVGLPVWVRLPDDDVSARFVLEGRGLKARVRKRPMMRAAQQLVERVGTEHEAQQRELRRLVASGGDAQ